MKYSEKLKSEVKRIYPNWDEANKFAESGNAFLGRYLCDSQNFGISIKTILKSDSLAELKAMANIEMERINLYDLWRKEAKEQGYL